MHCDADVLIAGGGPAGLATAILARQAGFDAIVAEPRSAPIDKACGEGLMPAALAALARLDIDPQGRAFRGITYVAGQRRVEAPFRNGTGRGVRRTVLHDALHERAVAVGVQLIDERITAAEQIGDGVRAGGLTARWLVAADGLHSPLRTALGLQRPTRHAPRWGLRAHHAIAPWSDTVEVHWAAHSEAYVTPVADDLVGIAVLTSKQAPYAEQLAAFPALAARVQDETATTVRGAGPLRQNVHSRVAGRVLLVGDAAGYVDALTGEGIAVALHSAEALVRCLVAGRPEDYEREWLHLSRSYRVLTHGLLFAAHRRLLRPTIVPAAAALPRVFARIVHQLGG